MNAALLVGAITEILMWVGLGAAVLFGALALIARLVDGTWAPIRAVVMDEALRWFGDDGVQLAVDVAPLAHAADVDEVLS